MTNTIYIVPTPANGHSMDESEADYSKGVENFHGDVIGYAIAYVDGRLTKIAGHFSSSIGFFRSDMGLTSDWKHDIYKKTFPEGYELKETSLKEAQKLPKWNRQPTPEEEAAKP